MAENELEARTVKKINAVLFTGMIILWPVNKAAPSGWVICNGASGTPSLTPPDASVVYIIKL